MNKIKNGRPKKRATAPVSGASEGPARRPPKPERAEADPGPATAEARSRHILSAILAFRDGNFSVRLPADWSGTDGRTRTRSTSRRR